MFSKSESLVNSSTDLFITNKFPLLFSSVSSTYKIPITSIPS